MRAALAAVPALAVSLVLSVRVGAVPLSFSDLLAAARGAPDGGAFLATPEATVFFMRLSRAASCVLVGSVLALVGSVLQRLLRNPLADPFVLGISSGGTLAVVAATVLGAPTVAFLGFPLRSAYAFVGCAFALGLLLAVRGRLRGAPEAGLALMGLVLNAFFGAVLMLLVALASAQQFAEAQAWMLGSLQPVEARELAFLAALAAFPAGWLLLARTGVDALVFGDDFASTLGFRAHALRRRTLLAVGVLVSLVVSVSGSVGFVGLIVPHLARALTRRDPRAEWVLSGLMGATLLIVADAFSRTAAAPAELPVGVFTACLGAPVLGYVLLRRAGREEA